MKVSLLVLATAVLVMANSSGCGGNGPLKSTVQQNAFAQIEGLGDMAMDETMFANAFMPGSVPPNRQDYAKLGYTVGPDAAIDGDTASVPVMIFGGVFTSQEGSANASRPTEQVTAEKVWTLQRVGDEWKIKDAPIK